MALWGSRVRVPPGPPRFLPRPLTTRCQGAENGKVGYLTDEHGQPTAIVVPIALWKQLLFPGLPADDADLLDKDIL